MNFWLMVICLVWKHSVIKSYTAYLLSSSIDNSFILCYTYLVPRNLGTARQKERPRKGTTVSARTTLVDRRLATLVFEGIAGDIPEETIKRHSGNKAPFHRVEEALLRADLTRVDLGAVIRLLQPTELSNEIRRFAPGVLDAVRALGGQFAGARMTEVPGGETLGSQRRNDVIRFRTDLYFSKRRQMDLQLTSSQASQVIYLPNLVEGSLGCTFDKGNLELVSVEELLGSLPKVEGLRWICGNAPTICRVLANHLKETTDEYLLKSVCTWTTEEYKYPRGLFRLLVGFFDSRDVFVSLLGPERWPVDVGLFVLGVPVPE